MLVGLNLAFLVLEEWGRPDVWSVELVAKLTVKTWRDNKACLSSVTVKDRTVGDEKVCHHLADDRRSENEGTVCQPSARTPSATSRLSENAQEKIAPN
jgi:hypothetical protein